MKKIFTILLISTLFAGELEVDGDLNVSGDIQSPTIAQLQEIIAQLQAEIAALQQGADNKLETRMYDIVLSWDGQYYFDIDLFDITGHQLDFAIISVPKVSNYNSNYQWSTSIAYQYEVVSHQGLLDWIGGGVLFQIHGQLGGVEYFDEFMTYNSDSNLRLYQFQPNQSGSATVTLAITAQFPD